MLLYKRSQCHQKINAFFQFILSITLGINNLHDERGILIFNNHILTDLI